MVTEKMIEALGAETTVDDHLRNLIQLMKRGGRVSVTDIPNDPTFLSSHFGGPTVRAMAEKIEAALSPGAEPVAIYKGNGLIDCGDCGHHNIELLKLIPANTPLYVARPAPSVAVKALEDAVRKELEGIDKEETYDSKGWWETSTGSSFGAEKLNAVLLLIRTALSTQVQDVAELTKSAVEDALDKAADLAESPCACRSCGAVVPSSYAGECCSSPNIDTATPQQIGAAIRALPAAPAAKLEEKP